MQELIPLVPFSSDGAREGEKAGTMAHKTKIKSKSSILPLSLTIETTSSQGKGNGKQVLSATKVTNRGEATFINLIKLE